MVHIPVQNTHTHHNPISSDERHFLRFTGAHIMPAANALRDLCYANRAAPAPHIGEFAELHTGLNGIPAREIRYIVCICTLML
jgi:hypothetical protein